MAWLVNHVLESAKMENQRQGGLGKTHVDGFLGVGTESVDLCGCFHSYQNIPIAGEILNNQVGGKHFLADPVPTVCSHTE